MASVPQSKPRVAIYVRSATQSYYPGDDALARQERACRAYAATHGYTVAEDQVYHEIMPGTARAPHPGLNAAIGAIGSGAVACILVAAPNRVSRSAERLARVEREVQQAGGRIEYVQEVLAWR